MFAELNAIGNVVRDIELRYIGEDKTPVAEFTIAVDDGYGEHKVTNFIDITTWRKTAEVCSKYLTQGSRVFVKCGLRTDKWEKDGQKYSKLKFTANTVKFLTPKNSDESATETSNQEPTEVKVGNDVPF